MDNLMKMKKLKFKKMKKINFRLKLNLKNLKLIKILFNKMI